MNSFLAKFYWEKKYVDKERLPFNCLAKGHMLKDCKSSLLCRIEGCMKKPRQTLMSQALK